MSFVLDYSVTMRWFFGDGKPQELAYSRYERGEAVPMRAVVIFQDIGQVPGAG